MFTLSQKQFGEACQRISQLEQQVSQSQQLTDSSPNLVNITQYNQKSTTNKRMRSASHSSTEDKVNNIMESDSTQPKQFKPPPIFIANSTDGINIMREITSPVDKENIPIFKNLSNDILKVQTKDENVYRQVRKFLNKKNIPYYTHQLKSEKPYRVVIRGLHPETNKTDIVTALKEYGHEAKDVVNVIIKKKSESNKSSDKVAVPLPLFFVALEPKENNKQIYEIQELLYQRVTVETPHKKKEVPQCKTCQQFGHTRTYCTKIPKCVKCGDSHKTEDCRKSKKTKAQCANCAGNHTANWKGCEAYQKAQNKFAPKIITAQARIKEKVQENYVTNGRTFASSVAEQSISHPEQEQNIAYSPPPTQVDSTAAMTLSLLQSIQRSIENIESRLQKLENSKTAHSR